MEKVKCNCNELHLISKRVIRERLTAAAAAHFPDSPLVGAQRQFYMRTDGYVKDASPMHILPEVPKVFAEVIDDGGYVALKLDFFNC